LPTAKDHVHPAPQAAVRWSCGGPNPPHSDLPKEVGELTARLRELLEPFLIYPHRDVPGVEPVLRRDGADGAPSSTCDRRRADRAAGEGSVFESGIHSCMDGYPVAGGATAPWRAGEPGFGHTRVGLSLSGRPGPLTALPGAGVAPIRALAPVLAHADDCMSHRSERVGRCVPALELDEVRASSPTVGSLSQCAREGAARAPRRRELEQARRVRKGVDVLAGDKAVADGEAVDAVPLDQRGLLVAKS
jgi:hypothetical protein